MSLLSLFLQALVANSMASESMGFLERIKPPVDISKHGHLIDSLFYFTTWLILVYFVFVCIGLFGFAYKYWNKKSPKATYLHGTSKKHVAVVAGIGAAVFITIDMQITRMSNEDFINVFAKWPDESKEEVLKVQVLAQQWAWNYRYAGKDGVFNTEDDVVTLNDLHLPINKKIVFQVTSKDVIHSFFISNARQKVDAMPGRVSRMWIELTAPGKFEIACAEMCGTYHYRMASKLTVHTEEDFKTWMDEAEDKADQVNDKEDPSRYWGWKWQNAIAASTKN